MASSGSFSASATSSASTSTPLNVICLISGGKDSFYSLLHVLRQGHRVVALANLFPPDGEGKGRGVHCIKASDRGSWSGTKTSEHEYELRGDAGRTKDGKIGKGEKDRDILEFTISPDAPDLNSFMYQSVGHTLIPLYAEALQLPLYRAPILGGVVSSARDYVSPKPQSVMEGSMSDETESLIPLLQQVLQGHPSANALCSGAILSTYQRTRVESVCLRLGLVPLSPLWQYPVLPFTSRRPSAFNLLEDLAYAGVEARIIKVASGGLDDSFLWEDLSSVKGRARIKRALERFDGSVIGEGGEFETLVVGGPMGVWKKRLLVNESERVVIRGDGGEAGLGFKGGKVEILDQDVAEELDWKERIRIPSLWDERFDVVREAMRKSEVLSVATAAASNAPSISKWNAPTLTTTSSKSTLRISNISPTVSNTDSSSSITDQTQSVLTQLQQILQDASCSPHALINTTILLRRMSDFPIINTLYGSLFTIPLPPARATMSCGDTLPEGVDVMLSATADFSHNPTQPKEGLHVQSRSYWAPANIGPYSQSKTLPAREPGDPSIVFVAGQIPLVPSTQEPLTVDTVGSDIDPSEPLEPFLSQALLSLQHLWRIGHATGVSCWTGAVAFLARQAGDGGSVIDAKLRARYLSQMWRDISSRRGIEDDDDEAKPDSDDNVVDIWDRAYGGHKVFPVRKAGRKIPDWDMLPNLEELCLGFFAVEVQELPRGCSLEWLSCGFGFAAGEDATLGNTMSGTDSGNTWIRSGARDSAHRPRKVTFMAFEDVGSAKDWVVAAGLVQTETAPEKGDGPHVVVYTSQPKVFFGTAVQIIPCFRIWADDAEQIQAGLVVWEGI